MCADIAVGALGLQAELLPGAFALSDAVIHNQSVTLGAGPIDIMTPPEQWAFAVTFPFRLDAFRSSGGRGALLVRIEAAVKSGRIGIGCVTSDLRSYVTPEIERTSEDGDTAFDVMVEPADGDACAWLVVRNTAEGDVPSRVIVRTIRTFKVEKLRPADLIEAELPAIVNLIHNDFPRLQAVPGARELKHESSRFSEPTERNEDGARRFQVLLTHTSRSWDWTRCTREYLTQRYADLNRLHNIPPFEELAPCRNHQLYSGGLSLMGLAVAGNVPNLAAVRCIDSRFKIQHASFVGPRLVLCFEDFLAVIPDIEDPVGEINLRPGSSWRIDDNWFGGLHTVFPVDDHICIVSSSGADAVLWVDLVSRTVIRRWRLPAELYGMNYELTPDMSVVDHYIFNDIQLAHLNCAYPDGSGGCFISTLIQGDIGHVDQSGRYSLLDRGHVGCHGVRLSQNGQEVYFTDSCGGRLMRLERSGGGAAVEMQRVDSRWLHDIEEVDSDLYWFCLGDKNEVALIDVARHWELGRFGFDSRGVNVQFVTIIRG